MPKPSPLQIGEHISIRISSEDAESDIVPVILPKEGKSSLKAYTLVHKDASYIALHFETMDFDPHCTLEISDTSGERRNVLIEKGRREFF